MKPHKITNNQKHDQEQEKSTHTHGIKNNSLCCFHFICVKRDVKQDIFFF